MELALNKESSIPLYQQLIDAIVAQITSGQLKINDRIMTENELSKTYDVSRITVRKAIELLVEEGILIKKQGIGTFVAEKKLSRVFDRFLGFTEICEEDGKVPASELLCADLINPTSFDVQQLGLAEGEKALRIMRLRKSDGVPVVIEENHFSTQFAFLLAEDLSKSMYEVLRRRGIVPSQAIKRIDICYANELEAEKLEVEIGSALLLQKDIIWDKDKNPIHTCKSVVNPARYRMTIISN